MPSTYDLDSMAGEKSRQKSARQREEERERRGASADDRVKFGSHKPDPTLTARSERAPGSLSRPAIFSGAKNEHVPRALEPNCAIGASRGRSRARPSSGTARGPRSGRESCSVRGNRCRLHFSLFSSPDWSVSLKKKKTGGFEFFMFSGVSRNKPSEERAPRESERFFGSGEPTTKTIGELGAIKPEHFQAAYVSQRWRCSLDNNDNAVHEERDGRRAELGRPLVIFTRAYLCMHSGCLNSLNRARPLRSGFVGMRAARRRGDGAPLECRVPGRAYRHRHRIPRLESRLVSPLIGRYSRSVDGFFPPVHACLGTVRVGARSSLSTSSEGLTGRRMPVPSYPTVSG